MGNIKSPNQQIGIITHVRVPQPSPSLDLRLTSNFDLKADAQLQRYSSPVSPSGHVYAKAVALGIVYRILLRTPHARN